MEYDNSNKGTLGKNKRKEKESHPDYSGQINVAGVDYWLSAWLKTNASTGEKFFSLAVKPKVPRPSQVSQREDAHDAHLKSKSDGFAPQPKQFEPKQIDEDGDDIPF